MDDCVLLVRDESSIGISLEVLWNDCGRIIPYDDFVLSLDDKIEEVVYESLSRTTKIKFVGEEYKNWFGLRFI